MKSWYSQTACIDIAISPSRTWLIKTSLYAIVVLNTADYFLLTTKHCAH